MAGKYALRWNAKYVKTRVILERRKEGWNKEKQKNGLGREKNSSCWLGIVRM